MKTFEVIKTDKAPIPSGWYSQAFRTGNLIFTAGVTAADPETCEIVASGDIAKQTEQVLKNLEAILLAAGSRMENVIKTLVFIKNINDFEVFNEVYKKFFPNTPPARSTIEVGKFLNGMEIEIEAIAVVAE